MYVCILTNARTLKKHKQCQKQDFEDEAIVERQLGMDGIEFGEAFTPAENSIGMR